MLVYFKISTDKIEIYILYFFNIMNFNIYMACDVEIDVKNHNSFLLLRNDSVNSVRETVWFSI